MSLESIRLYVNVKPQPREGIAFATKFGWAVPNRFDNKKFTISYELHGLDAVLFTNDANTDGGYPRTSLKEWQEVVEAYGREHFSQVVLDAVDGFTPLEEPVFVSPVGVDSFQEPIGEQPSALPVMPEDMVHGDLPIDTETTPQAPMSVAPQVEDQPQLVEETADVVPVVEIEEPQQEVKAEEPVGYTLEQLTAMEMDELRALAKPYGVKDISKAKLAAKLLAAMQQAE